MAIELFYINKIYLIRQLLYILSHCQLELEYYALVMNLSIETVESSDPSLKRPRNIEKILFLMNYPPPLQT